MTGRPAHPSSAFNAEEVERLIEWFGEWDWADGVQNGADDLDLRIKAKLEAMRDAAK